VDRFRVRSWNKYQSQKAAGGKWCKLHSRLFRDPEIVIMPTSLRFQFLAILGLVTEQGNSIPSDEDYLSSVMAIPRAEMNLAAFYSANLIEEDTSAARDREEEIEEDPADDSLAFAQSVRDYWNEKVEKPKVRGHISDKRRKHINARRNEHGDAAIFEAIDNRAGSAFMSGENRKGWIAKFSWLFDSAENFSKTIEGNYKTEKPKEEKTRTPKEASGSDFFYADRCCKMRGLDAEDMTQPERIDILNEDLTLIVTAARAEGKDIRGSIADLFKWYTEKFGGHPGKEGTE
jgi:hypothetical protein